MSTAGALDDYLDELLGATAPAAAMPAPPPPVVATPRMEVPGDSAELEAAFEAALAAAQHAGDAPVAITAAELAATPLGAANTAAPAQIPGDSAELEAAFEAALVATAAANAQASAEPTWDDVPPEPVIAAPSPEPTWDDLPDEVIYETDATHSATLAHTDSPSLQAAFDVAAGVTPPAPVARATAPVAPPAVAAPARPTATPNTWQEIQAQATRPRQRRASERTSRWLRLRCGTQAYALELLKVQEVVLPVPLLALRGAAPSMLGIMNLRGQAVPVLDLCRHLGMSSSDESAQTRIVVLEEHGEILGLRVTAVEDVANLTDSQIEPPDTARICQISNELFKGIARLGGQPMILLDATRLLQ